jgi:hypothetical protein
MLAWQLQHFHLWFKSGLYFALDGSMPTSLAMSNRSERVSESEMVACLTLWYRKNGYRVTTEVPIMGQSADIVAQKESCVIFLEAKLYDWKRGLAQCRAHEAVADFIYIAIASKKIAPNLENEARNRGYGVLHFCLKQKSVSEAVQPRKNELLWPPQRAAWAESFKSLFPNESY